MWVKDVSSSKIVTLTLHAGVWAMLFIIPFYFRPLENGLPKEIQFSDSRLPFTSTNPTFPWILLFTNLSICIFFYLNAYYLLPNLLLRKKTLLYFISILGVISTFVLIDFSLKPFLQESSFPGPHSISIIFPLLVIFAVSTAFRFLVDKIKEDKLTKEKENENLKTELLFLRSQISPHFIFNILNNLVSLARKKSDQLEPILLKLSSLIRYMLYESAETVSLETEIEYLHNYIELQKLRFGDKVKVDFKTLPIAETYSIEPMILIPFVENAFKHGVGMINNPRIEISIHVENDELLFDVRNRFNPIATEIKDKNSGIGLPNLRRRLDLLYRNSHVLTQNIKDEWYISSLSLKLK